MTNDFQINRFLVKGVSKRQNSARKHFSPTLTNEKLLTPNAFYNQEIRNDKNYR